MDINELLKKTQKRATKLQVKQERPYDSHSGDDGIKIAPTPPYPNIVTPSKLTEQPSFPLNNNKIISQEENRHNTDTEPTQTNKKTISDIKELVDEQKTYSDTDPTGYRHNADTINITTKHSTDTETTQKRHNTDTNKQETHNEFNEIKNNTATIPTQLKSDRQEKLDSTASRSDTKATQIRHNTDTNMGFNARSSSPSIISEASEYRHRSDTDPTQYRHNENREIQRPTAQVKTKEQKEQGEQIEIRDRSSSEASKASRVDYIQDKNTQVEKAALDPNSIQSGRPLNLNDQETLQKTLNSSRSQGSSNTDGNPDRKKIESTEQAKIPSVAKVISVKDLAENRDHDRNLNHDDRAELANKADQRQHPHTDNVDNLNRIKANDYDAYKAESISATVIKAIKKEATQIRHNTDTEPTQYSGIDKNTDTIPTQKRHQSRHNTDTRTDTNFGENSEQKKNLVYGLTGLKLSLMEFLCHHCITNSTNTINKLSYPMLSKITNIPEGSIRTTAKRLKQEGLIDVRMLAKGPGALISVFVPQEVINIFLTNHHFEGIIPTQNRHQSRHNTDTRTDTTASSSSILNINLNKKTTTREQNTDTTSPDVKQNSFEDQEWEMIQTPDVLKNLGFGKMFVDRVRKQNICTAEQLQEYFNIFAFDIEENQILNPEVRKQSKKGPISNVNGFFYSCLVNGGYNPPANYKRTEDLALEEMKERRKEELRRKQQQEQEIFNIEFALWVKNADLEEIQKAIGPLGNKAQALQIKNHDYSSQGEIDIDGDMGLRMKLNMVKDHFRQIHWPEQYEVMFGNGDSMNGLNSSMNAINGVDGLKQNSAVLDI